MNTLKIFKDDFYQRIGGLDQYKNKKVLDLGCGDGEDSLEIAKYAKKVTGVDITVNPNWKRVKKKNLQFKISKAEKLPFKDKSFDGLFLKDVIHHVNDIKKTLKEIKRVTTKDALIILIEGNRYNPLFFIHMTKMHGHEHLTQKDFKNLVLKYFPYAKFTHFESHFVPLVNKSIFKQLIFLEKILDRFKLLTPFLSYNMAKIQKEVA